VLFRGTAAYPAVLGDRPGSPDVLFIRGRWPKQPAVAVVGTRRCTAYGRNLATAYGHAIAEAGWVLVSGLARGIDGAAHRGTVAAEGAGIAVLGCGLDIAYPREHAALRDQLIAGGGAVVSEYPPGTPPEAWRFPPRNRIISGASRAVVVVEAAIKGGALITAHTALDQGIPVFATPGDVGRASAAGCNQLIRDGAHPVLDPADLIAELELILGPAAQSVEPRRDWGWEGITVERMATSRAMTVAEAAATLANAELAGALVRRGDRYYPVPDGAR
jgi:DNA processing protein